MYILDDIVCADEPAEDIKIVKAKPLKYKMLLLTFSTGETRLFDADLLEGSAFKPLNNENVFNNITLNHGAVTWNNGEIDCAPEYMYENSYPYSSASSDDVFLVS